MKKLKFLSVLLAMLTAFSCISAFSTSAAETKTISLVEITEVPDDIFTRSAEELLYGLKIKISYSDNSSGTYDITQDLVMYGTAQDESAAMGLIQAAAIISADDNTALFVSAANYIGDFIEFQAAVISGSDNYQECTKKVSYPEDYDCPEVFCKDYLVYKTNSDNTLTLINHNVFPFDYSSEEIVYPEIVIPETIHGKTVTSVADYALLGYEHPSSVTIPGSVTSIGEYAFGYCIDFYTCGDNHMVPDNVLETRLSQKLAASDDDEKFIVRISLYSSTPRIQGNRLRLKYFKDCTDYVYDEEEEEATATITKAQIYSMKDEEDILIEVLYTKTRNRLTDEVYDFSEYVNGGKIPASIALYVASEEDAAKAGESFSKNYFGGRTGYTIDSFGYMYIDATLAELEKASDDDLTLYIDVKTPEGVEYDLFKKLYYENDAYKTDVFLQGSFGSNATEKEYKTFARKNFSGCNYEILMCENTRILIVKGATKRDIMNAGSAGSYQINTFSTPIMNNYQSLVIYGENGSAAQTYAEENSIEFIGTGSEYQLGDVNLDGIVNVTDATDILKYNVELLTFNDEQKALADFDGNGIINVSDVSELQRAIVNS
ncbi:MAG: dockerin type I repeat-containing protein [Ruminococcus sp.]